MKNNKTTIFLDIDGVLSTPNQFNLTDQAKSWIQKYNCYPFDQKCVKVLNEILKETDSEIILSSDWKHYFTLEEIQDIFKANKVIKQPIAFTENNPTTVLNLEKNRADEILEFVKKQKIEKYLAIDDLDLSPWLDDKNFVLCGNVFEGIKQSGLKDRIISKMMWL